jgi:hypothetical protein
MYVTPSGLSAYSPEKATYKSEAVLPLAIKKREL